MTWGRATMPDGLPYLPNYEQAVRLYENTKPFKKGSTHEGERPLGTNRKYDRVRITHINNGVDVPYIGITHYKTTIARIFADGEMWFDSGSYDSISTFQILCEVFGGERFVRKHCRTYYAYKKDTEQAMFYSISGGLAVNADRTVKHPESVVRDTYAKLDRKALNKVRAEYAEFLAYARTITSLSRGGRGVTTEIFGNGGLSDALTINKHAHAYRRERFMRGIAGFFIELNEAKALTDEVQRHTAYLRLVEMLSLSAGYANSGNAQMNHTTREVEWKVTPEMVAKFFTEMLKLNRASEMFNVCLEIGRAHV